MNKNEIHKKVISATKWSTVTQIVARLVSPITNMILARILVPEAFGVVATITMIISFAEMFADSGFQKYLVQHEFDNEQEKHKSANVAFWTNFAISIFLLGVITIFRNRIALLVGNPGLGNVLAIASIQMPLTAFSSIQMALYTREFDFKTLFLVRLISAGIPFMITIPLALVGLSYWSLVIGSIAIQLSNAIILTVKSSWRPKLCYCITVLKEMFSFSIWSLVEAVSIWLTTWVDAFILGNAMNQYYLGLYKTSISMVNTLMLLITGSIMPVLFSTLSRLQRDDNKFKYIYLKFQRHVSILVFPLGIGVYLYSDLATQILLGENWNEASAVIGQWALTSSIMIVFGQFCSEVYRSKGRPKLSFLAQVLHLVVLVPVCIVSSKYGFWTLVYSRSWIRMQFVLVHFIIMKYAIGLPVMKTVMNVLPTAISAIVMGCFAYFLKQLNRDIIWSFISIILSAFLYFGVLLLFPSIRKEIFLLTNKIIPKKLAMKSKK